MFYSSINHVKRMSTFDCQTACGAGDIADAWMHYISCLGEPLTMRRSFIPEMIKSVEDID